MIQSIDKGQRKGESKEGFLEEVKYEVIFEGPRTLLEAAQRCV